MKRFILNSEPERNGTVRLTGDDYHYLARVRRLAPGEYFPGLLPSGEKVLIRVNSVDGGVLTGMAAPENAAAAPAGAAGLAGQPLTLGMPPLILFQGLPKGEKMDLIVRQAAEGGLAEIVPFAAEYSAPKLREPGKAAGRAREAGSGGAKISRWRRIIKEARQQSGSGVETAIRAPLSADELFAYWETLTIQHPGALGLALHQIPLEHKSLHGYLDSRPPLIVAAIGPEGGFSQSELARFLEAGFKPVTIGSTVLRTETAAVYAAAAIHIIMQERDSWETKK